MSVVILDLSVTMQETFSVEMTWLDLALQNGSRSNLNMVFDSPYATSYLMEIVMLSLSFTVCEIFTVKTTVRIDQSQM